VLSFRYDGVGELVIAPAVVKKEARNYGAGFRDQLRWMVAHGILHLSGRHHESSKKAKVSFERTEEKLIEKVKRGR